MVWALFATTGLATADLANAGSICALRTPPSGAAEGGTRLNPGGQRLRSALSADGLSFSRSGLPILDQAATPSLIRVGGLPYLYYTAHKPDGMRDGAALSIGSADGLSWQHCTLSFSGLPNDVSAVDPDLVAFPGGGLRMYITGPVGGGKLGVHYADSSDGRSWSYGGIAFSHSSSVLDSATFSIAGSWHMYVLDASSIQMLYATSADGNLFTFQNIAQRQIGMQPHVISQAAQVGAGLRLFAFGPPNSPGIRSFTTSNGSSLMADNTVHLSFDPNASGESTFNKDPAVVQLTNGQYLMVYSTVMSLFRSGFEN